MASKKIKGITIEIGADSTGLDTALSKIEKKSKAATSEVREVDRALKDAPESVVLWTQKQELLTEALEESRKKVKLLEDAQEQVENQFKRGDIDSGQYRAFQRELEKARSESDKLSGQLDDTTEYIKKLGGEADNTAAEVTELGNSAENSSEGFTILKGAIADLAADGFRELTAAAKEAWVEVDEGYDTIITKTGASGEALQEMQDIADNVFSSLPVEMNTVGTAVGEINTRFNATGKQLEGLTEQFLKYAEINQVEVNSSIDNVSGAMKAFDVDISYTADVLGILTSVGQKTGKSISSLESELLSNSATFKEMGLSIGESAQLLGQFEINGVDTSTALAGLKKAQQNATEQGKSLSVALSENIIAIKNAKTDTEALQIATDLFGRKGAAAMTQAIREGRFSVDDLSSSMENMGKIVSDTYEATQDAPDKMKIATNKLKLELASLAEKVLPKVEKVVSGFTKHLPEIEDTLTDMKPIIIGVGTAFAAWKIASVASNGVNAVKNLSAALKTGDGVMKAFNLTMKANPAVAVTSTVLGLTAAIIGLAAAHKSEKSELEKLIDKEDEQQEKLRQAKAATEELLDSANKNAEAVQGEMDRVEALWKELDNLTDSSGKVKDSQKEHAQYILNELNSALGTEYQMIGNQIQGYRDLKQSIEDVIDQKRAERLLDTYQQNEAALIQQQSDAKSGVAIAKSNYDSAKARFDELEKLAELMEADIAANGYANYSNDDLLSVLTELDALDPMLKEYNETLEAQKDLYFQSTEALDKNAKAEKLIMEGKYNDAVRLLSAELDANKKIIASDKATYEEKKKAYDDALQHIETNFELALEAREKGYEADAQNQIDAAEAEIEELIKIMKEGGLEGGDVYTEGFVKVVNKMVDAGFDISGLTKWGVDSGLKVGDVFGENYEKVVQAQLDAGYDVRELLIWGEKSGYDTSKFFTDEFTKKFQSTIDMGFNTSKLIEWAQSEGINIGQLFGKNFSKYAMEYTYANRPNTIDSPGDVRMFESGRYQLGYPQFADGGYLASGKGIVAEAGPELIEIVNGGAKITPLTSTARNTPVESTITGQVSGRTVVHQTFNINVKEFASPQDARTTSQELARLERQTAYGKGK